MNNKSIKGNNSRNSGSKEEKNCFKCKKPGHFIADCPEASSKDKSKKFSSKTENFRRKFKKSLMATFENLEMSSEEDDEEANVALMDEADSDADSEQDTNSERSDNEESE